MYMYKKWRTYPSIDYRTYLTTSVFREQIKIFPKIIFRKENI